MATGDSYSLFPLKATLGLEKISTYGLSRIANEVRTFIAKFVGPNGFWLDEAYDGTVDYVDIDITNDDAIVIETGRSGFSASGRLLVTNTDGASSGKYPFPNAGATNYNVYLKAEQIPTLVERTKANAYASTREVERLGLLGTPDSVTNNGDGTLTFNVSTLLGGANAGHVGRKVRVWYKNFQTTTTSVAFEECSVTFSGGVNKITTVAKFGQTSPTTTASLYSVFLIGPIIRTTTYSSTDALFVGVVAGGGTGNPPASKTLTAQAVWTPWWAPLSKVIRLDTHGEPKIRVMVDASDSGEPQLEVMEGSTSKWSVDEEGNVAAGHSGNSATSIELTTLEGTAEISADNATLLINSIGTDGVVVIDGVAVVPPDGNGNDTLIGSVVGETFGGGTEQSIVGFINSASAVDEYDTGVVGDVVYGAIGAQIGPAITGLGTADITVGAFAYRSKGQFGWHEQQVLSPGNGTWYLIAQVAQPQQGSAVLVTAQAAYTGTGLKGSILLAKVVLSGGVITSITPLARPARFAYMSRDIQVGPVAAGADFATLKEAVDFVNNVDSMPGFSSTRRWTIRVVGSTTEAEEIVLTRSSTRIVGAAPGDLEGSAFPLITWTHTGHCLRIEASNVEIDGLNLRYSSSSDCTSAIKLSDSNLSTVFIRRISIDILSTGVNLYGVYLGEGDHRKIVIEDSELKGSEYGILRAAGDQLFMCRFENNRIRRHSGSIGFSNGILLACDVSGFDNVVRGNTVNNFYSNIVVSNCSRTVVDNNRCDDFHKYGISMLGSPSLYCVVRGNMCTSNQGSELTSYGIYVAAPRGIYTDNNVRGSTGASTFYGIQVDASPTDYCILTSNQTNGQTLNNDNGANTTAGANRDDA